MNGELKELYSKLDKRIAVFEAVIEERWRNHANRGDRIDKNIDKISEIIKSLPCDTRSGFYNAVRWQLGFIWLVLAGTLLRVLLK